MNESVKQTVFCAMQPMTWYRPVDLIRQLDCSETAIQTSLRELSKGGVIERVKQGRNVVYITNQSQLF